MNSLWKVANWLKSIRKWQIKKGIYIHVTEKELQNTQTLSGKKFAFQLNGKKYKFEKHLI